MVIRGLVLMVGLCATLAPLVARAQTNLDEGKSAAQIFAADCVECHKAPRSLAKGKSVAAVADFLREHYTTNRQQAAALAAYVAGGRGGEPVGGSPQGRSQRPAPEGENASAEEPKPPKRQPRQAARPEDTKRSNAKLRPVHEEANPDGEANRDDQPGMTAPEVPPHESRGATASRGRRNEPKNAEPPQEPGADGRAPAAAVSPGPSPEATPGGDAGSGPAAAPSAAAPSTDAASGESGESAPVPRDNIPD